MAFIPELTSVEPGNVVYLKFDVVIPGLGVFTRGHKFTVCKHATHPGVLVELYDFPTKSYIYVELCDLVESQSYLNPKIKDD